MEETPQVYLDTSIFIYAAINREEIGERARFSIKRIREGEAKAFTSALTFDELFWKVKNMRGFVQAMVAAKAFLEMPNLFIIETNKSTILSAYELIGKYQLDPRDAIHAASALNKNIKIIISTDKHFDRVKELKRKRFI